MCLQSHNSILRDKIRFSRVNKRWNLHKFHSWLWELELQHISELRSPKRNLCCKPHKYPGHCKSYNFRWSQWHKICHWLWRWSEERTSLCSHKVSINWINHTSNIHQNKANHKDSQCLSGVKLWENFAFSYLLFKPSFKIYSKIWGKIRKKGNLRGLKSLRWNLKDFKE